MDDQPKTRLICRRCAARMKLARQLPWLDHRLPAILPFQCIDYGHVDMVEWPESEGEPTPNCLTFRAAPVSMTPPTSLRAAPFN